VMDAERIDREASRYMATLVERGELRVAVERGKVTYRKTATGEIAIKAGPPHPEQPPAQPWTSEMRQLQAEEEAIIRRDGDIYRCADCWGDDAALAVSFGRCVLHWLEEFDDADISELREWLARRGESKG
jgi:hypothetical protein